MSATVSQITSLTIVYSIVYPRRRSKKKKSKLRVTGLCEGNSPVTGEFPAKRLVMRKMLPFDDVIMNDHWWKFTKWPLVECQNWLQIPAYTTFHFTHGSLKNYQTLRTAFLNTSSWIKYLASWMKCYWHLFLKLKKTSTGHRNGLTSHEMCGYDSNKSNWCRMNGWYNYKKPKHNRVCASLSSLCKLKWRW